MSTEVSSKSETLTASEKIEVAERLCASKELCRSARLREFLRYTVQRTITDKAAVVSEREIGVNVFGRHENYDNSADNIVRVNASELRKRIAAYYLGDGHADPVLVELPRGSYSPIFSRREAKVVEEEPILHPPVSADASIPVRPQKSNRSTFLASGIAVLFLVIAGFALHFWTSSRPIDQWWAPIVSEKRTVAILFGTLQTAKAAPPSTVYDNKSVLSTEDAAAISDITGYLQSQNINRQVQSASEAGFSELRDRPIILVSAFQNQWTLRLLAPLAFTFSNTPLTHIQDNHHPNFLDWRLIIHDNRVMRDYGIVSRFRDQSTGDWVMVIAGVGRNGTEAAGMFVTNPDCLQELESKIGRTAMRNKSIEAVVVANVVGGVTGRPSVERVAVW